jgi:glycosyltransferase involved in cell wall biosynthesis
MIDQTNSDKQPLVSVIIPTHNRSDALVRALTSLKKQTYTNLEAVIIDDASSDDTQSKVGLFEAHLRILYFRNNENQGASRTRNIGLQKATGEYFALLDDDDEFLETKIEVQLKTALSLKEKAFILCNGLIMGKVAPYAYDLNKPSGFVSWGKGFFPVKCKLPPPSSWFFHRELVDKIGYFDEAMSRWEDIDYCMRLMAEYPVYMINELLVKWHTSANSLTGMSPEDIKARKYFLGKHFDWIRRDRDYLYKFYWRLGKDLKKLGKTADAAQYFRNAFFVKPYKFEALVQLIALSCQGRACQS